MSEAETPRYFSTQSAAALLRKATPFKGFIAIEEAPGRETGDPEQPYIPSKRRLVNSPETPEEQASETLVSVTRAQFEQIAGEISPEAFTAFRYHRTKKEGQVYLFSQADLQGQAGLKVEELRRPLSMELSRIILELGVQEKDRIRFSLSDLKTWLAQDEELYGKRDLEEYKAFLRFEAGDEGMEAVFDLRQLQRDARLQVDYTTIGGERRLVSETHREQNGIS